jgi:hypothetical protein
VNCTANFTSCGIGKPVRQKPTRDTYLDYATIQAAYNNVNTVSGNPLYVVGTTLVEPALNFNRSDAIAVTVRGGYSCNYGSSLSYGSFIKGTVTVSKGTVTFDNITIM